MPKVGNIDKLFISSGLQSVGELERRWSSLAV
jgi:hypothetical protein